MPSRQQEELAAIRADEAAAGAFDRAEGHKRTSDKTPAEIFMGQLRNLNWQQDGETWVADIKAQHTSRYHNGFDEHGAELGFSRLEDTGSHVCHIPDSSRFEIRLDEGEFNRSGLAAHQAQKAANGSNGAGEEPSAPQWKR